jgi:hypothetical protein
MAQLQPEHHPGLPVLPGLGGAARHPVVYLGQREQQDHNQPLVVGDFLWQFWTSTLENWQSEFLQLLTFVVLTTFLIHRDSHESRDSDDEMQRSLNRIEQRLKALEETGQGGKAKASSSN